MSLNEQILAKGVINSVERMTGHTPHQRPSLPFVVGYSLVLLILILIVLMASARAVPKEENEQTYEQSPLGVHKVDQSTAGALTTPVVRRSDDPASD